MTLESLKHVAVPANLALEVLVIENGSKDDTEKTVHDFAGWLPITYIHCGPKGKSRALNLGIDTARGDMLLFADDDVRFPSSWLSAIAGLILDHGASAVAGGIQLPDELVRRWMTPYHKGWLGCLPYSTPHDLDEMPGANMAIHRSVLEKVSRFDTELGGGGLGNCEDTLFSRQIREAGHRIVGASGASLEHHFDPSKLQYEQWVRSAIAAGRSRAYLAHHWYHKQITYPALKSKLLGAKLRLRRRATPTRPKWSEGIPAWELSYICDRTMLVQYQHERLLPQKYDRRGLVKLYG